MAFQPTEHAVIDTDASGATEVVPAREGKRIVVLEYLLIAEDAVKHYWQSSGGSALTGSGGGGATIPAAGASVFGLGDMTARFRTEPGEALELVLSDAVQVNGYVNYYYR